MKSKPEQSNKFKYIEPGVNPINNLTLVKHVDKLSRFDSSSAHNWVVYSSVVNYCNLCLVLISWSV